MLMLGITVGVALSVVFPYWLITVLIIILFIGTSSRSFFRGTEMWKEETILKKEMEKQQATFVNSRGELLIDTKYEPLIPRENKSPMVEKDSDANDCVGFFPSTSNHQGIKVKLGKSIPYHPDKVREKLLITQLAFCEIDGVVKVLKNSEDEVIGACFL
ncbi:hypothetical protein RIF29_25841 [Crotalaria pallida]|uniref:Uncharacterized protein n=1 Tax=Crotalaria pallida TaxID=3830 RepID=A0AAN9EPA6_CROPI